MDTTLKNDIVNGTDYITNDIAETITKDEIKDVIDDIAKQLDTIDEGTRERVSEALRLASAYLGLD